MSHASGLFFLSVSLDSLYRELTSFNESVVKVKDCLINNEKLVLLFQPNIPLACCEER